MLPCPSRTFRQEAGAMKIKVSGNTPLERLTNLTRGLLAVPKSEIDRAEKKRQQKKQRRKRSLA